MTYTMLTPAIAKISGDGQPLLGDVQSALDLISAAWAQGDCTRLIVMKEEVSADFFDLSTKIAGEALQKFVNYNFRLAIVGDYSGFASKSLKDFIYESNKGRVINFCHSIEDAITRLG